jgi:hypothetical protein
MAIDLKAIASHGLLTTVEAGDAIDLTIEVMEGVIE